MNFRAAKPPLSRSITGPAITAQAEQQQQKAAATADQGQIIGGVVVTQMQSAAPTPLTATNNVSVTEDFSGDQLFTPFHSRELLWSRESNF